MNNTNSTTNQTTPEESYEQ